MTFIAINHTYHPTNTHHSHPPLYAPPISLFVSSMFPCCWRLLLLFSSLLLLLSPSCGSAPSPLTLPRVSTTFDGAVSATTQVWSHNILVPTSQFVWIFINNVNVIGEVVVSLNFRLKRLDVQSGSSYGAMALSPVDLASDSLCAGLTLCPMVLQATYSSSSESFRFEVLTGDMLGVDGQGSGWVNGISNPNQISFYGMYASQGILPLYMQFKSDWKTSGTKLQLYIWSSQNWIVPFYPYSNEHDQTLLSQGQRIETQRLYVDVHSSFYFDEGSGGFFIVGVWPTSDSVARDNDGKHYFNYYIDTKYGTSTAGLSMYSILGAVFVVFIVVSSMLLFHFHRQSVKKRAQRQQSDEQARRYAELAAANADNPNFHRQNLQAALHNNAALRGVIELAAPPRPSRRQGCSQEMIDAIPIIKFMTGLYSEEDAKCVICLDEYNDYEKLRVLWCKHHFHKRCIENWLRKHQHCPMCQQKIDEALDVRGGALPNAVSNAAVSVVSVDASAPGATLPHAASHSLVSISARGRSPHSPDQRSPSPRPLLAPAPAPAPSFSPDASSPLLVPRPESRLSVSQGPPSPRSLLPTVSGRRREHSMAHTPTMSPLSPSAALLNSVPPLSQPSANAHTISSPIFNRPLSRITRGESMELPQIVRAEDDDNIDERKESY